MDYLPVFLRLTGQPCLVVGGGRVALRKARDLLRAGAQVTVNAPMVDAAIERLAATATLRIERRSFDARLVSEHLLVVAATSDPAVNEQVAAAARDATRICNVVDDRAKSSFISPAIVDRSPLIVAVSGGGRAPALTRLIRQRIEKELPRGLPTILGWVGAWRSRVRTALPGGTERRRFWENLLATDATERLLAGDRPGADGQLGRLLAAAKTNGAAPGHAWLVGAGPGDPALITLRGLEAIRQADTVVHDRLIAPELLDHARREAELICVGKTGGGASARQEDINRVLIARVSAGERVCRLKGGDPLIFGRGGEEALALARAKLSFEIIPGVTAANGCAAAAGIPLTHRKLAAAVTFVTAQTAAGATDWEFLGRTDHTVVVYMGARRISEIANALIEAGRRPDQPAAVVAAGTLPAQRVVTASLATIADSATHLPAPAVLIVGDTVGISLKLAEHALEEAPTRASDASVI